MASIKLVNASVEFEILDAQTRSLKNKLIKSATGGKLQIGEQKKVVVQALSEVSLKIGPGEKVGLIGHNGAGKSTLLRMLAGIYYPTSGLAHIDGKVSSLIDISLGMDQESTGRENIFVRGALLGQDKKQMKQKLEEIIDFSELGQFIDMPIRTYSSGMSMRLAFAIATAISSEILIMDEWLSVGDEHFMEKAEKRMSSLLQKADILVLASHSFELIKKVCNRVIVLEHGNVAYDGAVQLAIDYYHGAR